MSLGILMGVEDLNSASHEYRAGTTLTEAFYCISLFLENFYCYEM